MKIQLDLNNDFIFIQFTVNMIILIIILINLFFNQNYQLL